MMERQQLPAASRENYVYLPAKRDDKVTETGRPKYRPIDTCKSYGVGCNKKTNYLQTSRHKRSSFTTGQGLASKFAPDFRIFAPIFQVVFSTIFAPNFQVKR